MSRGRLVGGNVVGNCFHVLRDPSPAVRTVQVDQTVLDLGCGLGRNMIFRHNVGVDLDREALKPAKAKCEVVVADVHHLPFRNKAFDVSLLINVLMFVKDPRRVLEEALRVSNSSPIVTVCPAKQCLHEMEEIEVPRNMPHCRKCGRRISEEDATRRRKICEECYLEWRVTDYVGWFFEVAVL